MSLVVYFHLHKDRPAQADGHALAQGFRRLGARVLANTAWWYESPDNPNPLFAHDPGLDPSTADIVVCTKGSYRGINKQFQSEFYDLPEWLTKPDRSFCLVYIEDEDRYEALSWYPPFTEFDLVLRTKVNKRAYSPANFVPWQLGVSDYVIERAGQKLAGAHKKLQVLLNFNATHPFEHPLRKTAKECIVPRVEKFLAVDRTVATWQGTPEDRYDAFHLRQAGQFFNPFYHDLLVRSAGCFAFCGDLVPGLPYNPAPMLRGGNKGRLKRALWSAVSGAARATPRSIQWDSYRFWECLAFACCPIHVDLEKYGVLLPVMPENWKHYIGLDFENLEADLTRLKKNPEMLLEIGQNGREWLVQHYSGDQLARRLISRVAELPRFRRIGESLA